LLFVSYLRSLRWTPKWKDLLYVFVSVLQL
jgi:hypothetical protein